jgi:hypothetical protein
MLNTIKLEVRPQDIIAAVKKMKKEKRDGFLEDLLASTSPEYLRSIKEARADYEAGRVKSHEEVFGNWNIGLFTHREPLKIYRGVKRKLEDVLQRPFCDIQRTLSNTQKNLPIQGWETIDLGLAIIE